MTSESLLTSALEYRARGWSVIPLKPGSKHPAIVAWNRYQKEPADLKQIHEWWGVNPKLNIGIVTGEVSNLLVIDVDAMGPLICPEWDTLIAKSPRGTHYYFHPDESIGSYISSNGISVKSQGGYVVAPPSASSDGTKYAWEEHDTKILSINTDTVRAIAPNRHAV